MVEALYGFEEALGFTIIKKTVLDHELVETSKVPVALYFEGVIEPLSTSKLMVKPEGERYFNWSTLYTDMALGTDWVIKDENGTSYRIMSTNDWHQAGFYTYELVEGPTS